LSYARAPGWIVGADDQLVNALGLIKLLPCVGGAWSMSDPGINIDRLARNERPMCEDCQKEMLLFSVKPGDLNFDVRTYECSGCAVRRQQDATGEVRLILHRRFTRQRGTKRAPAKGGAQIGVC